MDHPSSESSRPAAKKPITRLVAYFSAALVCTILGSIGFSVYREGDRAEKRFFMSMENKLEIAVSALQQETERLRIIADAVEEQSQKFADLMDYDNHEAITTLLQTAARRYDVDYVFLFDEGRRLLTTNYGVPTPLAAERSRQIIRDRTKRTGIETIPRDLVLQRLSPVETGPVRQNALCFKSVLPIIHDTGETYGFIVLVKLLDANRALIERIGRITGAEVVLYDGSRQAILSTLAPAALDYPQAGLLRSDANRYLANTQALLNADGRMIGALSVLLDESPLLQHKKELILAGSLPFFITLVICIALLATLKFRVFDKVALLSRCLSSAGISAAGLAVRVPISPRTVAGRGRDEVDAMAEGFNMMMDRLEETYNELREARSPTKRSARPMNRCT